MANTVLLQTFHRESRAVITFRFGTLVPDRMNGLHTVPALIRYLHSYRIVQYKSSDSIFVTRWFLDIFSRQTEN